MSYVLAKAYSTTKVAAATVTNIVQMPDGVSYIHRTGSTFLTNNVVPGDGAVIASSGAGNNGTYVIVSIPTETILIVRATLTNEAGVATVAVSKANHKLTITDETATNWTTITTQVAEPAICQKLPVMGSQAAYPWAAFAHNLASIEMNHTSAITLEFTSSREVVFCRGYDTTTPTRLTQALGTSGKVNITLGKLKSSGDKRSYYAGSAWIGINYVFIAGKMTFNQYGSFISGIGSSNTIEVGTDSKWFGNIVAGPVSLSSGWSASGAQFQDLLTYDEASRPPIIIDTIAYADNFLLGHSTAQAVFLFATSVVNKLGRTSQLASPPFAALFSTVSFVDLLVDEDLTSLIQCLSSSTTKKLYTFNPIFADEFGIPLQNAHVSIFQYDVASPATKTPISGSPFLTDANGRINTSGVLLEMQRQVNPAAMITYNYRIVAEHSRYNRMVFEGLALTSPVVDGRRFLKSYDPVLEGEHTEV